jgi:hypothetical protein
MDILPQIGVGVPIEGYVMIEEGDIRTNGSSLGFTTTNSSTGGPTTFFQMEPGRCIHHTFRAYSKSRKYSDIPVKPTCVKRTYITAWVNRTLVEHIVWYVACSLNK